MRKTITAAAFALGVFTLGATAAHAGPYPTGGVTAAEAAAVLKNKGLSAEITKDDAGDPMIKSATEGVNWRIYFYNCKAGRCNSIQFSAGFDLDNGITYSKANEWNYTKRFSRAALDDDMDPYVRYDVDAEKGFTSEALTLALETWLLVLPTFSEFVGYES
ncbi:MAG: YbjN domain-containing protein [Pseudomonadota bacterium]